MKKKILSVVAVLAVCMSLSTSAFASGIARDDRTNIFSDPNDDFTGYFSEKHTRHEFSWYNGTGKDQTYYLYFWQPKGTTKQGYGILSVGVSGPRLGASQQLWNSNGRSDWQVFVPAGDTLSVTTGAVMPGEIDPSVPYELDFQRSYHPQ
ncbi:hypothetical protein [Paenibacillus tyrfis]|uniref:Uncharacterized protein n=1 Tax=Paenibacillus tyrfis TaxID=1501230 RepID=A0A081NXM1_9BACL|nr:hypothetical protein [Paenibacillus tyrfis]KEQ23194.1 hypothetical protein ET33_17700 [Paenibacillus tyrfis]